MDGVMLTFFLSIVCSAVAVVLVHLSRRPKIPKPIDSPPATPITIGF